jgi:arylsulfatase A-like enzyme
MMDRRDFLVTTGSAAVGMLLPRSSSGETMKRPNIVLILCDDMGYSDLGCYGGEIRTPHLDRLAQTGQRFTQFYNCARCCPTRASLLTGLYPHQAGVGGMVNGKEPGPYQGFLNDSCVTIAEVLKQSGYATYMSGKWHVGEKRPHWPVDRGFDRHYGLISGAMNYFDLTKGKSPRVKRGFADQDKQITPPTEGFYATDAFTDFAVKCINEHDDASKPFFLYVGYTAPHWPLHALPEDIKRYRGKYIEGWPALRKQRYERMIKMGLIKESWPLSPQDRDATDWDALDDKTRSEMDHKMAIYAAQVDRMDQGIGKLMATLKKQGIEDNTLVMFLSDNGACKETGALGRDFRNGKGGELGTVDSYQSYGASWSNASNTPYRRHKSLAHEGGIATPLIVHWPDQVKQPGSMTDQVGHVIDIMATCCDVAGAPYPKTFKDKPITPMEGKSLLPVFQGKQREDHELIGWEHFGNRAARAGKWKIVEEKGTPGDWELYDLEKDRTELRNLATQEAQVLEDMKSRYAAWAKRVGV